MSAFSQLFYFEQLNLSGEDTLFGDDLKQSQTQILIGVTGGNNMRTPQINLDLANLPPGAGSLSIDVTVNKLFKDPFEKEYCKCFHCEGQRSKPTSQMKKNSLHIL